MTGPAARRGRPADRATPLPLPFPFPFHRTPS